MNSWPENLMGGLWKFDSCQKFRYILAMFSYHKVRNNLHSKTKLLAASHQKIILFLNYGDRNLFPIAANCEPPEAIALDSTFLQTTETGS